jgi:hypothetical protein
MGKTKAFLLLPVIVPVLAGCSPQGVAETISTAQVCSESAGILGDMETLLVSAAANPLAFETYLEKIDELSADFSALTPLPTELSEAHDELSSNFEELLTIAQQPSVGNLSSLPNVVAETQISLLEFREACSL